MGLFDFFKSKKAAIPLSQICYDMAYFLLPQFAYGDLEHVVQMCLQRPSAAGPFYYIMACQLRKIEPDREAATLFHWHLGLLDDREYFTLEFPVPPPIDLSDIDDILNPASPIVLAPHYCAIVRPQSGGEVQYFVLGQAPMDGGTTLRCVTREGANCNLGPGPAPERSGFIKAIHGR